MHQCRAPVKVPTQREAPRLPVPTWWSSGPLASSDGYRDGSAVAPSHWEGPMVPRESNTAGSLLPCCKKCEKKLCVVPAHRRHLRTSARAFAIGECHICWRWHGMTTTSLNIVRESSHRRPLDYARVLLTGLALPSAAFLPSHVPKPCPNLGMQGSTVKTIALLAL
jgi:hypothetical protein